MLAARCVDCSFRLSFSGPCLGKTALSNCVVQRCAIRSFRRVMKCPFALSFFFSLLLLEWLDDERLQTSFEKMHDALHALHEKFVSSQKERKSKEKKRLCLPFLKDCVHVLYNVLESCLCAARNSQTKPIVK